MARPVALTVGEALVDWVSTERGADLAAAGHWVKAPGGAPMNVAIALSRLGVATAFAGCLADDAFGAWLADTMAAEGVDTRLTRVVPGAQTRMAYITTTARGDRQLAAFSTVGVADEALTADDLPDAAIDEARAFVFGSLILKAEGPREAVLAAAGRAKANGGLVLFDPNVRPVLWRDEGELASVLERALSVSTVVKLGDDEVRHLAAESDLDAAAEAIRLRHSLSAVVVTRGAEGASYHAASGTAQLPGVPVTPVDPTGAGDAFVAGLLAGLLARGTRAPWAKQLAEMPPVCWDGVLRQACAVGALATTRAGAVAALPTAAELARFVATL